MGKLIAELYYLLKFKIAVGSLQTFRWNHHGVYEQNVYSFTVLSNDNEVKHADQHLKPSLKKTREKYGRQMVLCSLKVKFEEHDISYGKDDTWKSLQNFSEIYFSFASLKLTRPLLFCFPFATGKRKQTIISVLSGLNIKLIAKEV